MEPQQLATKVAQLESRVATLEDEGKIVKGEVKQILTEIRSAILVRDNPFDMDGSAMARGPISAAAVSVIPTAAAPVAKLELVMPEKPSAEEREAPRAMPPPEGRPIGSSAGDRASDHMAEPVPLRPQLPAQPAVVAPAEREAPRWSLLTIAGLSAWAEDAVRRLGPLRLEILLDLCEAAGHLTPASRAAMSRVTEIDPPEPAHPPSTNETAAILRQLEALVSDADGYSGVKTLSRF